MATFNKKMLVKMLANLALRGHSHQHISVCHDGEDWEVHLSLLPNKLVDLQVIQDGLVKAQIPVMTWVELPGRNKVISHHKVPRTSIVNMVNMVIEGF